MCLTGDVGVEEHRTGVAPYGVDDVVLDRALHLGVGGQPSRFEHLDERIAVVDRDDGEASAGIGDPRERAGSASVRVAVIAAAFQLSAPR